MFDDIAMHPIMMLLIGIAVTSIGYGPLSLKKHPAPGPAFVLIGFLFRLAGPLILVWDSLFWIFAISMMFPPGIRR